MILVGHPAPSKRITEYRVHSKRRDTPNWTESQLMTEKPGYCALCRSRCGTINVVDGDRLVEVRANPNHPTGTSICPKGRAAPEIVHSPRRLLYPLKRSKP